MVCENYKRYHQLNLCYKFLHWNFYRIKDESFEIIKFKVFTAKVKNLSDQYTFTIKIK